ncbi:putative quinol monooxygenase [Nonomuraea sp. NPDC049480]|uniref:putative quinol monooxygenase n=1 Tax=Nonomuraea sp. NPDC049480 TaxID=3364353 RepID=UPI0037B9B1C8
MGEEIVIAGWIDWEPAHRDEALVHLREAGRHSRMEPGCLDYAMTADPDDERRIRVYERWASAEALEEHLATPHIKAFREAAAGLVRHGRSLHRLVIQSSALM